MSNAVSQTQAEQSTAQASDQARVVTGKNARYTETGSVQVGDKGTLKLGNDFSGVKGNISIANTTADPQIVSAALSAIGSTAQTFAQSLADQNASMGSNQASTISKITDLATSSQTGGVSTLNTTFLWFVGGVIGLFALMFYFSRNK